MLRFGKTVLAVVAAVFFPVVAPAAPIDIVVPAYFYPSLGGSAWDQLTVAAQSGVRITAIVNPGSGPGTSQNADYVRAITAFRAAGGVVLGYVPSGYLGSQVEPTSTCQPSGGGATYAVADVVSCAARYNAFYAVDGIFVDEFGAPATGATAAQVQAFYTQIYDGLKGVNAAWSIVGNPGQAADAALLRSGAVGGADRLVTFENQLSAFAGAPQNPALAAVANQSLINIIYGVTDAGLLESLIAQLAARNVGGLFLTDDGLPNPYDTLPAYFTAEIAAVQRFNAAQAAPEPATAALTLLGFCAITSTRRRRSCPS